MMIVDQFLYPSSTLSVHGSFPRLRERFDNRTGKVYKTWHFSTLSNPIFTYYHNLFYVKKKLEMDIEK